MKTILKTLTLVFFLLNTFVTMAQKPIVDGTWKIKSVKDSGKMLDVGTKETTVTINSKGKNILVYVGCNRLSSTFEFITGDLIKPMQVVATRKACHGDIENLENAARYVLEQTNSVRKSGARIEFYKDNDLLMVLERFVEPAKKKKK